MRLLTGLGFSITLHVFGRHVLQPFIFAHLSLSHSQRQKKGATLNNSDYQKAAEKTEILIKRRIDKLERRKLDFQPEFKNTRKRRILKKNRRKKAFRFEKEGFQILQKVSSSLYEI